MKSMRGQTYLLTFLTTLAVLHVGDRIAAGILTCQSEHLPQCPRAIG